jgi:calcium-activated chloride channel regulator 3/4
LVTGRQLLREWIKYRYGVFDEVGYRSDELYPLTYNEANQLFHNDCSTYHNSR